MYNSEKINDFIKHASSMHVLNTTYFLGLVVAVLYSYALLANPIEHYSMGGTIALLSITLVFKFSIQYIPFAQKFLGDEQIELLLAGLNVVTTYLLLRDVELIEGVEGEYYSFLISFLPTLLFILISPISWSKRSDVSYYGFFGFVEWSLLICVSIFVLSMLWGFYEQTKWLSLMSNGVVLASPFLLSMMRKRHMESLKERIYQEIYQDPLTKIPNRKCFYDYYDKVRDKNKVLGLDSRDLVVFFVDIDYFKKYNDFYGHEKGDECLIEVASFIKGMADKHGLYCYRYGGEEFVLCGTKTKEEFDELLQTEVMLEWKQGNLTLPIEHEKSDVGRITLSAGAALISSSIIYESNAGEVTKVADQYLYKAKGSGRAVLKVASYHAPEIQDDNKL